MAEDTKTVIRGYKIVDKDLKGFNGFQFTVGQLSEVKGDVIVCRNGLHFCEVATNCLEYTRHLVKPWRFLSVTAKGQWKTLADKSATNALFIEKELTVKEYVARISKDVMWDKAFADSVLGFAASISDVYTMEFAKKLGATNFNEALRNAAREGDTTVMELAKAWGAISFNGALLLAAEGGHISAMELAKSWGEFSREDFNVALCLAAEGGHIATMELAKAWGANGFDLALNCAAKHGRLAAMRLAKAWGANNFKWVLLNAAFEGHVDAMRLLKTWGANDFDGTQHYADVGGHIAALRG